MTQACSHEPLSSGVTCARCGRLAELSTRLAPFELFALPRSVPVDQEALKAAHLKLARECHPDFNLADQSLAVKLSSHVNRSYRALLDRLGALRELARVLAPGSSEPKVDALFLSEMMEDSKAPDGGLLLLARLDQELSSAEILASGSSWDKALLHMARAGYCRSLSARAMELLP